MPPPIRRMDGRLQYNTDAQQDNTQQIHNYPHAFLKKRRGYCYRLRPSVRPSVRYAISS